jgi:hypothetical protein
MAAQKNFHKIFTFAQGAAFFPSTGRRIADK